MKSYNNMPNHNHSQKLSRKAFIETVVKTGLVFSASDFLLSCSSPGSYRRIEKENSETDIFSFLRSGIYAPNPHNTQAWKFRLIGEDTLELFIDEKRLLPETDPPARQIHIGAGCFIEQFCLAAEKKSYKVKLDYFPTGEYGIKDCGKKPVAILKLLKSEIDFKEDRLFQAIAERTTNRSVYSGNFTESDFLSLKQVMGSTYSELRPILDESKKEVLKRILYSAFEIEMISAEKSEESRIWFRYGDEEIFSKKDGISLRGSGISGLKLFFAETFFFKPGKESWYSKSNIEAGLSAFKTQLESSPAFIYLKTKNNQMLDWVLSGRDYARLNLATYAMGFAMSPMSQILQEYREMEKLFSEFNTLMEVKEKEKIQMIVRVGKSDYRFYSPRRNLNEFLLDT
ncbi:MAG: hypothetical protein H7A25_06095 [Leptospiraceae bacterium]|nr:hypothetical protein [Leptospiraceae bacterium]MCP5499454.1 hypothetical protein [Leptospiraceae bacterium]